MFISTKTYNHELGLSCAFRQWRAKSHCRFLHGYALAVRVEFGAEKLDENGWVVDFGGMKQFKKFLEDTFDHKTLAAHDDPMLAQFEEMESLDIIDLMIIPAVGCEAFAKYVYEAAEDWVLSQPVLADRVKVLSVEVREHGANSAIYTK